MLSWRFTIQQLAVLADLAGCFDYVQNRLPLALEGQRTATVAKMRLMRDEIMDTIHARPWRVGSIIGFVDDKMLGHDQCLCSHIFDPQACTSSRHQAQASARTEARENLPLNRITLEPLAAQDLGQYRAIVRRHSKVHAPIQLLGRQARPMAVKMSALHAIVPVLRLERRRRPNSVITTVVTRMPLAAMSS